MRLKHFLDVNKTDYSMTKDASSAKGTSAPAAATGVIARAKPSKLSRIAISLLGPDIEHRDSLRAMLHGRVSSLSLIPDSPTFRRCQGKNTQNRFSRVLDQIWGTREAQYLDLAIKTLDRCGSSLIIAFWGTMPLPDLVALKKARPKVKTILMVLCYPLALEGQGIRRQGLFMRRASRFLDGVIYPSHEMADYFSDSVRTKQDLPSVVIPPCWPANFQGLVRPEPLAQTPNLVYTGRTDLAARTIHAADDLRSLMRAILDSGIDLHHCYSAETDDGHPRRKPFRPMSLPDLIQKMASFDASLIAYNTGACPRADRFELTIPDRLITSVAAGVPVAIPKQGYSAAKSYLKDYPAVIQFDSPDNLRKAISDRQCVDDLRNAAWSARQRYAAEQYSARLVAFLERVSA